MFFNALVPWSGLTIKQSLIELMRIIEQLGSKLFVVAKFPLQRGETVCTPL